MSQDDNKNSIWSDYWRSYGGFAAFKNSWYFVGSLYGTIVVIPLSLPKDYGNPGAPFFWYDLGLNLVPVILGFILAGYAMLLAFSDVSLISALIAAPKHKDDQNDPKSPSVFKSINATFVHFIVVQAMSIFAAVIGKTWDILDNIGAVFGLWLLVYALALTLATAMAIFRISRMQEFYVKIRLKNEHQVKADE